MRALVAIKKLAEQSPSLFLLFGAAIWFGLYQLILPTSELLVRCLPVEPLSHSGRALQFFLYDTPKVLLLLTGLNRRNWLMSRLFTPTLS